MRHEVNKRAVRKYRDKQISLGLVRRSFWIPKDKLDLVAKLVEDVKTDFLIQSDSDVEVGSNNDKRV